MGKALTRDYSESPKCDICGRDPDYEIEHEHIVWAHICDSCALALCFSDAQIIERQPAIQ